MVNCDVQIFEAFLTLVNSIQAGLLAVFRFCIIATSPYYNAVTPDAPTDPGNAFFQENLIVKRHQCFFAVSFCNDGLKITSFVTCAILCRIFHFANIRRVRAGACGSRAAVDCDKDDRHSIRCHGVPLVSTIWGRLTRNFSHSMHDVRHQALVRSHAGSVHCHIPILTAAAAATERRGVSVFAIQII